MFHRINGDGPPVLLVHGLPTSGRLWDFLLPELEHSFTCIVVDLPGFGKSPLPENGKLDADAYAQTLDELRKNLGIKSWSVIGHDAGATIAVHYSSQFGQHVERLVLCSPPIFPELKIPLLFRIIRSKVIGEMVTPLAIPIIWRYGFPRLLNKSKRPTKDIISSFQQPFKGFQGARRFQHIVRWGKPSELLANTAKLLSGITSDTLILHGKNDSAIPTSFALRAAELIPNVQVHLLDCGHFLPLTCVDEVHEHLVPFLRQ